MNDFFFLGNMPCSYHSIPVLLDEVHSLIKKKSLIPRSINFINAHVYNIAAKNSVLLSNLKSSRIVAADGIAIVWSAKLFNARLKERCNMTEAFRAFLAQPEFPKTKAILVGGSAQTAKRAMTNINRCSSHCTIVDAFSGFKTIDTYKAIFEKYRNIDFIFIGMGSPTSENLVQIASFISSDSIIWHIGGGTIMFYANALREAPVWMRRLGLQWVHRFFLEPRRLWNRYLIGNFLFTCSVIKAFMSIKAQKAVNDE